MSTTPASLRTGAKIVGIRVSLGERLLHEHVLARVDRTHREIAMRPRRRCEGYGIDVLIGERRIEFRQGLQSRDRNAGCVRAARGRARRRTGPTNPGRCMKVSHEVGAPVTGSHHQATPSGVRCMRRLPL